MCLAGLRSNIYDNPKAYPGAESLFHPGHNEYPERENMDNIEYTHTHTHTLTQSSEMFSKRRTVSLFERLLYWFEMI